MSESCHDCGAEPGECHKTNCDTERCPACGGQALQCLRPADDGKGMVCDNLRVWVDDSELLPWDGEWPGKKECREYGFWCKWKDRARGMAGTWVRCDKDDPEASEDLNRLVTECVWDRARRKFVLPSEKPASGELITALQKQNKELREALENMLEAFDTPISRARDNSEFAGEARREARELVKRLKGKP
jgi:hypothetical protein